MDITNILAQDAEAYARWETFIQKYVDNSEKVKNLQAKAEKAEAAEAQLRLENQVFKMERKGLPITDIAEFTGLSIDEINTIFGK